MPSCARLLSYWTKFSERPWQDPFDTTKVEAQPDNILSSSHFWWYSSSPKWTPFSWQLYHESINKLGCRSQYPKGQWLTPMISVDCCGHRQYTAQCPLCSAKCGLWCNTIHHRNHMSFWPDLLHRHNCSFHLTWFKMMCCWVTRTELYASRHRIHCCRIFPSVHSTPRLLSACLQRYSNRRESFRSRLADWGASVGSVATLSQFNALCHRLSMELWFVAASAL
jgi:hypothetical protein